MVVWHVCSGKKLRKYQAAGAILPPVRAWTDINCAMRMSLRTGRRVILRLKFPDTAAQLEGHFGKAVVSREAVVVSNILPLLPSGNKKGAVG